MIVFEEQTARVVNLLPPFVDVNNTNYPIRFRWGNIDDLNEYLLKANGDVFPLVWLENGTDENDLREPSVKRNARLIVLSQTQAPSEDNVYQYEYDFDFILQPIANNLIQALIQSGISRIDETRVKVERKTKYSMTRKDETIMFICNAIVIETEVIFQLRTSCLNEIRFNN